MEQLSFQEHFDEISKIKVEETDTLDDVLSRLGEKLTLCLHIERVNIWIFKHDPNRIECIGNYIKKGKHFSKGDILYEDQIPSYFSHLLSDKTIRIKNVNTSKISAELKDTYCAENHIMSIMDIPVRIEGNLAGVICFEDCKTERLWSDEEKNFALAVSQIVSLTIENQKRKNYQRRLLKTLEEKNTLLVEMHHRLKNNLTMLVSLLRLQSRSLTDKDALEVVANFENQMLSISKLHEQLYSSGNYLQVDLKSYLSELLTSFNSALPKHINFVIHLEQVQINSDKAVTLGLIINEIISNAIKYATNDEKPITISVLLQRNKNETTVEISDNGQGFTLDKQKPNSFGLSLIHDLSEQLGAKLDFSSGTNGTQYKIHLQTPEITLSL